MVGLAPGLAADPDPEAVPGLVHEGALTNRTPDLEVVPVQTAKAHMVNPKVALVLSQLNTAGHVPDLNKEVGSIFSKPYYF